MPTVFRRWYARPAVAAAAILTLGLGIGAATTVYTLFDLVFVRTLPYPASDRIVAVWQTYPYWRGQEVLDAFWDRINLTYPDYFRLAEQSTTLQQIAFRARRTGLLTGEDAAEEVSGDVVSASLFGLLGVRPALGRLFSPVEDRADPGIVIVSHGLWQRLGGTSAVVGRTITIDEQRLAVVGVLPPGFRLDADVAYWRPMGSLPEDERRDDNHTFRAYARLKRGVRLEDAEAEVIRLVRGDRDPSRSGARLAPLDDELAGPARMPVLMVTGAAALLLLLACANVAGLLLGDASTRRQEVAIRGALGASPWRVTRQLLGESLVLAAAGGATGVVLASWSMPALATLAPATLFSSGERLVLDVQVLGVAVGLSLLAAAALGIASALALIRPAASGIAHGRAIVSRSRGPAWLVVAQIAMTAVLLTGAGLLARSLLQLTSVDVGFQPADLLVVDLRLPPLHYRGERLTGFYTEAIERLRVLPNVHGVAGSQNVPFGRSFGTNSFEVEGSPGVSGPGPEGVRAVVTPDFFRTVGTPIVRGRPFSDMDRAGSEPVAIVSRELERRYLPDGALDRRIRVFGEWRRIVGVAGDLRNQFGEESQSTFYLPSGQNPGRQMTLLVSAGPDAVPLMNSIRAAIGTIDRDVAIAGVTPMRRLMASSVGDRRYRVILLGAFGIAAALLALVGLYGTVSRAMQDRTRELGLRLALGARPGQLSGMALAQGTRLVTLGCALGLLGALAVGRAIRSQLWGVSPFDVPTLAAVVSLLALVAVVALWIPARRASKLDPVVALRDE